MFEAAFISQNILSAKRPVVEEAKVQVMLELHLEIFKLKNYHYNHSHSLVLGEICEPLWDRRIPLQGGMLDTWKAQSNKQGLQDSFLVLLIVKI